MERRDGVEGHKSHSKIMRARRYAGENNMSTKKTQTASKDKNTVQLWNNIKGSMRLWAKEHTLKIKGKKNTWLSFSSSIGKKNEEGEYDNLYFDVFFKKDAAPDVDEGSHEITIRKGFLTLSTYKDGSVHPAVMVLDYTLHDEAKGEDEDEDADELPF